MKKRQVQVADAIRDIIANEFMREIADPRLANNIVVTHVKLTGDLQLATVYYRILDEHADKKAVEAALGRCSGHLRKILSGKLDMRRLPQLRFYFDTSVEEGAKIEKMIEGIKLDSTTSAESQDESE
jgi:ribosome-binding factor A